MDFQIDEINYARYDYLNYCKHVLLDIVKYADEHNLTTTTIPFKNDMYFTGVPFVMHYTMHTIMKVFGEIANLKDYTIAMNEYNLRLKNLKALQTMSLEEGIKVAEVELPIYCPKCGNKMESLDDFQAFAYMGIKCNQCQNEIDTFGYMFDFEELNFTVEIS